MHSAAILAARPAWAEKLHERLLPGAHVVLLSADEGRAVEGRRVGFELRDTILLLWPETTSFAFLFRKPLGVDTLADQVAAASTGALAIAGCRISSSADASSGRWPPNILLIHGPRCQRIGERRIDGHKGYPNGPGGSSSQFSQKGTHTTRKDSWAGHADAEGKETIPVWECQPNCPAGILDRLSGDLPAGVAVRHRSGGKNFGSDVEKPRMADMGYGDSGGAARFYPQFASPWEVLDWLRSLVTVPGGDLLEEV